MGIYLNNVATLKLDADLCIGCGRCTEVCPHGVFRIEAAKAAIIDLDSCMECGACKRNCPVAAIEVKSGVGCAEGIIRGALTGTEPTCDCAKGGKKGCC